MNIASSSSLSSPWPTEEEEEEEEEETGGGTDGRTERQNFYEGDFFILLFLMYHCRTYTYTQGRLYPLDFACSSPPFKSRAKVICYMEKYVRSGFGKGTVILIQSVANRPRTRFHLRPREKKKVK